MNKIFLVAACAALCSCTVDVSPAAPRGLTAGTTSPTTILPIVRKSIPTGATVDQARSFLISEGFTCRFHEDSTLHFEEHNADGAVTKATLENVDYLLGVRTSRSGLVTAAVGVAVVFTEDRVSDVKVSRSLTGP